MDIVGTCQVSRDFGVERYFYCFPPSIHEMSYPTPASIKQAVSVRTPDNDVNLESKGPQNWNRTTRAQILLGRLCAGGWTKSKPWQYPRAPIEALELFPLTEIGYLTCDSIIGRFRRICKKNPFLSCLIWVRLNLVIHFSYPQYKLKRPRWFKLNVMPEGWEVALGSVMPAAGWWWMTKW